MMMKMLIVHIRAGKHNAESMVAVYFLFRGGVGGLKVDRSWSAKVFKSCYNS